MKLNMDKIVFESRRDIEDVSKALVEWLERNGKKKIAKRWRD